jgi:hypothetical protein
VSVLSLTTRLRAWLPFVGLSGLPKLRREAPAESRPDRKIGIGKEKIFERGTCGTSCIGVIINQKDDITVIFRAGFVARRRKRAQIILIGARE